MDSFVYSLPGKPTPMSQQLHCIAVRYFVIYSLSTPSNLFPELWSFPLMPSNSLHGHMTVFILLCMITGQSGGSSPVAMVYSSTQQATLVMEGSFGHSPHHPCLQRLGRFGPLHQHTCNKWVAALLWGWQRWSCDREDKNATVKCLASWKVVGLKTCHSLPDDLWRLWDYLFRLPML